MTHPAPNSEPKPGEIRVENGRLVRFIERELEGDKWEVLAVADADGWIPHDGGPNPVPGCRVDVRLREGLVVSKPSDLIYWPDQGDPDNVVAFRLAAPSVERTLENPDGPEAASRIAQLEAKLATAVGALEYYAGPHELPNDGPWGAGSEDFGTRAQKALHTIQERT